MPHGYSLSKCNVLEEFKYNCIIPGHLECQLNGLLSAVSMNWCCLYTGHYAIRSVVMPAYIGFTETNCGPKWKQANSVLRFILFNMYNLLIIVAGARCRVWRQTDRGS